MTTNNTYSIYLDTEKWPPEEYTDNFIIFRNIREAKDFISKNTDNLYRVIYGNIYHSWFDRYVEKHEKRLSLWPLTKRKI
jgi:hypothetical protein